MNFKLGNTTFWFNLVVIATLGLVAGAAVLGVRSTGYLQSLEWMAYDKVLRGQSAEASISSPIVIVGITERDIQQLGHYPLHDADLDTLVGKLQAHSPAAIGIDIYRDIPAPPGTEAYRERLLAEANLISIMTFDPDGAGIGPPTVLPDHERVGVANVVVDDDGVVRRGLLFLDDGRQIFFSFALRAVLLYLQNLGIVAQPDEQNPEHIRLGKTTVTPFEPDDGGYVNENAGGYQFLMSYQYSRTLPTYSMTEVLDDRVPSQVLKDRVVLVGITAESVKDFYRTSVSDFEYGVVVHGYVASELISRAVYGGNGMRTRSELDESLFIVFFAVIAGVITSFIRSTPMFLVCLLAGVGVIVIIGHQAIGASLWLPLVAPCAAWVLSATVVTSYVHSMRKSRWASSTFTPKPGTRKVAADALNMPSVFISAKSQDYAAAQEVYDFLAAAGIPAFFSEEWLKAKGDANFRKEIDRVLDHVDHMVVVGSSVDHIKSPWVEAEWGFFVNEQRSGRKSGNLVTVSVGGMDSSELPPALRQSEVIALEPGKIEKLLSYVSR